MFISIHHLWFALKIIYARINKLLSLFFEISSAGTTYKFFFTGCKFEIIYYS